MRWWDESMFAVNTYEMMHNGKYFSVYFNNVADLYNKKPLLTNWIQLFFVKLFGYNELALRLPSAIAAGLTIIVVFTFIRKHLSVIWAWLSALILLTSSGFIHFHTARTADSDSLLTFFLLMTNIYFITYILYGHKRNIFIFFFFISLAFATKMYAALLFTPAYFIVIIQQKKLKEFIFNWAFTTGIFLLFSSTITLLYLRELDTPGYLKESLFEDAGRFFKVVETHKGSTLMYLNNLFKSRFSIWSSLLIIGSVLIFFSKNKFEKNILFCFLLLVLTYLIIITLSATKLEWYDMPIYPYLSIIAAYPLVLLFQNIVINKEKGTSIMQTSFCMAIIFFYPYYMMFDKSQGNTMSNGEKLLEANERYIFKKNLENKNLDGIKIYYSGYKGSLLFYKYKLAENSQKVELVNSNSFNINDRVLVCNDSLKNVLTYSFNYSVIDSYEAAQLIQITDKK